MMYKIEIDFLKMGQDDNGYFVAFKEDKFWFRLLFLFTGYFFIRLKNIERGIAK